MLEVRAADVVPKAWRNGGGRTRELLTRPAGEDWTVRVSLADIDADGPFSAFPGVERWFVVVQGAGVLLKFADHERRITTADAPLRFDGASAPGCTLVDGPTRDLNLMIRSGFAVMREVRPGQSWHEPLGQRGLYARVAGLWRNEQGDAAYVAPHSLLWELGAGPCRFMPEGSVAGSRACGWWLGHSASQP